MPKEKKEYKPEITLWKAVKIFIYAGITAVAQWLGGANVPTPEWTTIGIAILVALENFLKHYPGSK